MRQVGKTPANARRAAGLLALVAIVTLAAPSAADTPEQHFREGTNALGEGKFDEAINHFEAYADRGAVHPDASYNRGLAYVTRIRAGAERPGDLGRAAAAFEETLLLRPDDAEAERALELVHAEVARQRSRRGKDAMTVRPTLDRLLVSLASERTWGIGAVLASVLLAAGLVLRQRRRRPLAIAGKVLTPTAALLLALLTPLYGGARHLRLTVEPAVTIAREVYLADEAGVSQGGEPIPEAARIEVSERRGRLVRVRWGAHEGWIPTGAVRMLRTR
ncbi:MAG: hypothetical protein JRI23_36595 [Deltaproteobacteria bacterium]|jgi:tetratricopeptide (TPR) repeat protein|nr:hypothetical protein [Deltaproteobacteria bacterium]MBW2537883.1 hypothetical protein [Deltaproteobacteria bacterium]